MNTQVYTVYDSKTAAYMQPFFMKTKGEAVRAFKNTVNDPEHPFHRNPEDFALFYLGVYDDESASFRLQETPEVVARAHELKDQQVLPLFDNEKEVA